MRSWSRRAAFVVTATLCLAGCMTSALANGVDPVLNWDWTLIPTYAEAGPGGTMNFDYTVTNFATSTTSLYAEQKGLWPAGLNYDWLLSYPVEELFIPSSAPLAPGQASTTLRFVALTFKDTTPLGHSAYPRFELFVNPLGSSDLFRMERTAEVHCTPELSSSALLLLGALPVGLVWWRRRRAS